VDTGHHDMTHSQIVDGGDGL